MTQEQDLQGDRSESLGPRSWERGPGLGDVSEQGICLVPAGGPAAR